jgi:ribosomal protein S12
MRDTLGKGERAMNVRKSKVLDLGGIKYKVLSGDIVEQEIVELLRPMPRTCR